MALLLIWKTIPNKLESFEHKLAYTLQACSHAPSLRSLALCIKTLQTPNGWH
jgi:hypothetical protein